MFKPSVFYENFFLFSFPYSNSPFPGSRTHAAYASRKWTPSLTCVLNYPFSKSLAFFIEDDNSDYPVEIRDAIYVRLLCMITVHERYEYQWSLRCALVPQNQPPFWFTGVARPPFCLTLVDHARAFHNQNERLGASLLRDISIRLSILNNRV